MRKMWKKQFRRILVLVLTASLLGNVAGAPVYAAQTSEMSENVDENLNLTELDTADSEESLEEADPGQEDQQDPNRQEQPSEEEMGSGAETGEETEPGEDAEEQLPEEEPGSEETENPEITDMDSDVLQAEPEEDLEMAEEQTQAEETIEEEQIVLGTEDASELVFQVGGFGEEEDSLPLGQGKASTYAAANLTGARNALAAGLRVRSAEIDLSAYAVPVESIGQVFSEALNFNPDLFYVEGGFRYYYSPSDNTVAKLLPSYSSAYPADAQKRYQTALNQAYAEALPNPSGMTDMQKARALHDYLAQHMEYDTALQKYNAYNALVEKKAVCQGYTLAYAALLEKAGISFDFCTSNPMNHIWNYVKIGGKWYHVDVTWDDPTHDMVGYVRHTYFLNSDSKMKSEGTNGHYSWVKAQSCTDTTYDNYYWQKFTSAIFYVNGAEYYLKMDSSNQYQPRTVLICRENGQEKEACAVPARWYVWGSSSQFWTSSFSRLSYYKGKLYFNDPTKVYQYNPVTEKCRAVYTYSKGDGYLYGALVCNNNITVGVAQDPNSKQTRRTVALPSDPIRSVFIGADTDEVSYGYTTEPVLQAYVEKEDYAQEEPVSYQWYKVTENTEGIVEETAIDGAESLQYAVESGLDAGAYRYRVKASIDGFTVSADYILTISPAEPLVEFTEDDVNQIRTWICNGEEAEIASIPNVTLKNGETYTGIYLYSYAREGSTSYSDGLPVKAGTYNVKVRIPASRNYTEAESTNRLKLVVQYAEGNVSLLYNAATEKGYYREPVEISASGYRISARVEGPYEDSWTLDCPEESGVHEQVLYLKNAAGQIAEQQVSVSFDMDAPSGSIRFGAKQWTQFAEVQGFERYRTARSRAMIEAFDSTDSAPVIQYTVVTGREQYRTKEALEQANLVWKNYTENGVEIPEDGEYVIYAKIADQAGNTEYLCSDGILADNTAPVISAVDAVQKSSRRISLSFSLNEAGTYYYMVRPVSDGIPSAEDIREDGTGSGRVSASELTGGSKKVQISVNGLQPGVSYQVYVIASDGAADIGQEATAGHPGNWSEVTSCAASFTMKNLTCISAAAGSQTILQGDGSFAQPAVADSEGNHVEWEPVYRYNGADYDYATLKGVLSRLNAGDTGVITYSFTAGGNGYETPTGGTISFTVTDLRFLSVNGKEVPGNAVTVKVNPVYGDSWDKIVRIGKISVQAGNAGEENPVYYLDCSGSPEAGIQSYRVLYRGTVGGKTYTDVTVCAGTVIVAKKTLSVQAGTCKIGKEYDGTTQVQEGELTGSLSVQGIQKEDTDVHVTAVAEAYTDADAGKQKKMCVTLQLEGEGSSNYQLDRSELNIPCEIWKKDLESSDIDLRIPEAADCTGAAVKLPVTLQDGEKPLTENVDYTVSYRNNIHAAKADSWIAPTVTIRGKGNYAGSISRNFTIRPKGFSDDESSGITVTVKDARYTGRGVRPAVTVKDGDRTLRNGVHYTLVYSNNIDGEYTEGGENAEPTVQIVGKGDYEGTLIRHFRIYRDAALEFLVKPVASQTYTGEPIVPEVRIETKGSGAVPVEGEDYTVSYENNINPGTARVVITGTGGYGGTKTVTFWILKRSLSEEAIRMNLSETSWQYNGAAICPRVTVTDGDVLLTEGVDYAVRYSNHTDAASDTSVKQPTVTVTGMGNYTGSRNCTFTIVPKRLNEENGITIFVPDTVSSGGKEVKPTVIVKDGNRTLRKGTHYTVTYKNNTRPGEKDAQKAPTVVITGKGSYTGSMSQTFRISERKVSGYAVYSMMAQMYTRSLTEEKASIQMLLKGEAETSEKILKQEAEAVLVNPDTGEDGFQEISIPRMVRSDSGSSSLLQREEENAEEIVLPLVLTEESVCCCTNIQPDRKLQF